MAALTRRPARTRDADGHAAGRAAALATDHTPLAVRRRLGRRPSPSYLHDFIYGAVDGAITTFAVVAGANLDETVVIILGGANLVADGFNMAASNFLGSRADRQQREHARRQEELHIELVPEGEREEIRQIYAAKGFAGDDLARVVEVITADRELWARTMMSEELGFAATQPNEYRAALSTLLPGSLVASGSGPLDVACGLRRIHCRPSRPAAHSSGSSTSNRAVPPLLGLDLRVPS